MEANKFSQLFASVNRRRFRYAVFVSPLLTATLGFLFSLVQGKGLSESLFFAAFLFLLMCVIGLVYYLARYRNLR